MIGKELMLRGRRDWRQGIKSTGIIKRLLQRKGRLVKEFRNFLYGRKFSVGTVEQSYSHFYVTCESEVLMTHYIAVQ
jgi:hypothetical protein